MVSSFLEYSPLDRSKLTPVVEEEGDKTFAQYIDHSLLRSNATDAEFNTLTDEAIQYGFASVCVAPYIAGGVVKAMSPYPHIKVGSVCAFPQGNLPLNVKLKEAHFLINDGVDELDFVLHYGEILNGNWEAVEIEMKTMGELCASAGVVSKCIVETPILESTSRLKKVFEILSNHSCIDYIKSSTGMSIRDTKVEEISFWNELRDGRRRPKIKAAGGIRTYEQALQMIEAGADRLGMSASVKVMEEYRADPSAFIERGAALKKMHQERDPSGETGALVI